MHLQAANQVQGIVELLVVLRVRRNVGERARFLLAALGSDAGQVALEAGLSDLRLCRLGEFRRQVDGDDHIRLDPLGLDRAP